MTVRKGFIEFKNQNEKLKEYRKHNIGVRKQIKEDIDDIIKGRSKEVKQQLVQAK